MRRAVTGGKTVEPRDAINKCIHTNMLLLSTECWPLANACEVQ